MNVVDSTDTLATFLYASRIACKTLLEESDFPLTHREREGERNGRRIERAQKITQTLVACRHIPVTKCELCGPHMELLHRACFCSSEEQNQKVRVFSKHYMRT